jgi:hypothetical protein
LRVSRSSTAAANSSAEKDLYLNFLIDFDTNWIGLASESNPKTATYFVSGEIHEPPMIWG